MMPLQTQAPSMPGSLDEHIHFYGCKEHVGGQAVMAAWGDIPVTPQRHYEIVRDCVGSGRGIIKDNDAPIDMAHPDRWFRVEVQDMKAWIEFFGKSLGYPVKATRCAVDRIGWKDGKWFKGDSFIKPGDCNFIEGEWDTDCLPGGLSHFTTLEALSGPVKVAYNPDPKIHLYDPKKALVSVRFWNISKA